MKIDDMQDADIHERYMITVYKKSLDTLYDYGPIKFRLFEAFVEREVIIVERYSDYVIFSMKKSRYMGTIYVKEMLSVYGIAANVYIYKDGCGFSPVALIFTFIYI